MERHPLYAMQFVPPPDAIHLFRALLGLLHGLRLLAVEVDLSPVVAELVDA